MHFRTQQRATRQCFQSGNSSAAEETAETRLNRTARKHRAAAEKSIDPRVCRLVSHRPLPSSLFHPPLSRNKREPASAELLLEGRKWHTLMKVARVKRVRSTGSWTHSFYDRCPGQKKERFEVGEEGLPIVSAKKRLQSRVIYHEVCWLSLSWKGSKRIKAVWYFYLESVYSIMETCKNRQLAFLPLCKLNHRVYYCGNL